MPAGAAHTTRRRAGPVTRAYALERSSLRELDRHRRAMRASGIEDADQPIPQEELEQPTSVLHRAQALANANYPGKRRLSNAYDERVCKRRNTDSLFGTPWDDADDGLEKPAYDTMLALAAGNNSGIGRTGVENLGNFGRLPFEIRSEIFKIALDHGEPIIVLKGWSLVYIRDRPSLSVHLLRVCRSFYEEGLPALYGSNTFHYKIRDPPGSHRDTNAVVNKVFQDPGFIIPINKHGHLFRNIEVSIEANRMHTAEIREHVAKALQKFVPGHGLHQPAQLRCVIIQVPLQTRRELRMKTTPAAGPRDVPSADFFKRGSCVSQTLANLNCQFIEIVGQLKTPIGTHGICFRAVIDRRPHFTQQSVDAGDEDPWANDVVALARRKRVFAASQARFELIGHWITRVTLSPFRYLGPNALFQPYVPYRHTKPLHSLETKYRTSKPKDASSSQEQEPAEAGPSEPARGEVTFSRGHNVTITTPIAYYSTGSEYDVDEDARRGTEFDLDSDGSSEDSFGNDEFDDEYVDNERSTWT
ncbi:hypothetical protein PG993_009976 [Apiospora rasikravindrae]|uniref:Uncharacterized protein n=1 Tax=Apiospora rasikravindrae TaxID=990691 RepID=A0ABR1SKX0_9PEZI